MALTRAQRRDVADAAAYRILGEKTWKWRMVRDHLPHISGVVLLGAAGLGPPSSGCCSSGWPAPRPWCSVRAARLRRSR
jgi:hypothetical protein